MGLGDTRGRPNPRQRLVKIFAPDRADHLFQRRIRKGHLHHLADCRPVFDLLRGRAVKQPCLPLGSFNQVAMESDGLAHAGNLWQIATDVKPIVLEENRSLGCWIIPPSDLRPHGIGAQLLVLTRSRAAYFRQVSF